LLHPVHTMEVMNHLAVETVTYAVLEQQPSIAYGSYGINNNFQSPATNDEKFPTTLADLKDHCEVPQQGLTGRSPS